MGPPSGSVASCSIRAREAACQASGAGGAGGFVAGRLAQSLVQAGTQLVRVEVLARAALAGHGDARRGHPARPATPISFQGTRTGCVPYGPWPTPLELTLDDAVATASTGDVWLFRGRSVADVAIRTLTNSPVNHVGMVVALDDLPPLLWHAELGRSLPDVWTGERQRGVQLHRLARRR